MKESAYGFSDEERHLSDNVGTITYVIKESNERSEDNGYNECNMPKMRNCSKDDGDSEA